MVDCSTGYPENFVEGPQQDQAQLGLPREQTPMGIVMGDGLRASVGAHFCFGKTE